MKRILALIIGICLYGCYSNERNCKDFKEGTFSFNYSVNGEKHSGKFTRTEDLNIDYFEGKVDSASIRWINDCEFIQTKINPQSRAEEAPIHMKILSTTDSSYTFEYKLAVKKPNSTLRVEKGTAYVIR
ncbi:hypothetical protein [Winogradskyella sp. A3E31]|uniref:hypothetical protein n=1 Tax=Winogradskyella sp. A3E31 TaxID=3349637 RepID=UPI00398A6F7B